MSLLAIAVMTHSPRTGPFSSTSSALFISFQKPQEIVFGNLLGQPPVMPDDEDVSWLFSQVCSFGKETFPRSRSSTRFSRFHCRTEQSPLLNVEGLPSPHLSDHPITASRQQPCRPPERKRSDGPEEAKNRCFVRPAVPDCLQSHDHCLPFDELSENSISLLLKTSSPIHSTPPNVSVNTSTRIGGLGAKPDLPSGLPSPVSC